MLIIGFMDFLGNLFKKIGLICLLFGLVFWVTHEKLPYKLRKLNHTPAYLR